VVPDGPLIVIPTFLRREKELAVTLRTLETIRATEPDAEVFFVDDGSPERRLVDVLAAVIDSDDKATIHLKAENTGFSKTVNVGLRRALDEGRDAILCNADIEFLEPGWIAALDATTDSNGLPAAVVGALLLYANGLIQHAGIYVSFLERSFDHRMRFAPATLPEAHVPQVCPVTGALQLIRHSTLETIGIYDEAFSMAFEDVDYCLRVFNAGLECIYQPGVRAVHHESLFRGQTNAKLDKWHKESINVLASKHATTDLGRWIPQL
jgi:GT2 family glycosyltransferase